MNYRLNKDKDKDKDKNKIKDDITKRIKNLNNIHHEDNSEKQIEINQGISKSKDSFILEDKIKKEPKINDIKIKTNRADRSGKKDILRGINNINKDKIISNNNKETSKKIYSHNLNTKSKENTNNNTEKENLKKIFLEEIFLQINTANNYEVSNNFLSEISIDPYGNCFYCCILYYLYKNQKNHLEIKKAFFNYIKENP